MALNWEDSNFLWEDNPHTWDDVQLVVSLVESRGASVPEILWQVDNLDPEKKRRFIKLVCKVKGIETYSGQKTIRDDIKISAEDIELVVEKVLGNYNDYLYIIENARKQVVQMYSYENVCMYWYNMIANLNGVDNGT